RRAKQRFPYLLPVSFRQTASGVEAVGFTQDLSSRDVFLLTDAALTEGDEIEITLSMPSEITLGESMRVKGRGRVLTAGRPTPRTDSASARTESKIGVAVRLEGYEYLTETSQPSAAFARVSALHPQEDGEKPVVGR